MNTYTYHPSFDTLIEQNPHIVCRRDKRKTAFNLLSFAIGILFIFLSNRVLTAGNEAKFLLSSVGVCMVGIALIYLIHGGRCYLYLPAQSRMTRGTKFYSRTAEEYFRHLQETDTEDTWSSPIEDRNGGIRIEYIYGEADGYLLLLPSIYEDLTYQPLGRELLFSGAQAKEIAKQLGLDGKQ